MFEFPKASFILVHMMLFVANGIVENCSGKEIFDNFRSEICMMLSETSQDDSCTQILLLPLGLISVAHDLELRRVNSDGVAASILCGRQSL